jgi:phospholipid/cholesterol/gamma-HCH transport system substrate-binding protein
MSSITRLGAFVLIALTSFGIMVFLIGDKELLFSRTYRINAPFDNVAGLDEGAPVRAGGVRIGTVKRIVLPRQPQDKITVQLELDHKTREVIKKDSVASIETEGLLGAKYLAVSFGSPDAEQVSEGDTIDSRPPLDYGDVARKASAMLESAKDAIDSSKIAIGNVNDASADLKSITGKIDSGKGTMGALINDRTMYRNLNGMVDEARAGATSFQENMEALKHNFLVRGFFKKRGYYDSSELTKNAVTKLPASQPARSFAFDGKDLFAKNETAKLKNEKRLDQVGTFLEHNPHGLVVVTAQTGAKGNKEENVKLSQARAMVVREYLAKKFKLEDAQLKTLGAGEDQKAANDSGSVSIVVYPGGHQNRAIQARNK